MSRAYPFDDDELKDGIISPDKYNGLPEEIRCWEVKEEQRKMKKLSK